MHLYVHISCFLLQVTFNLNGYNVQLLALLAKTIPDSLSVDKLADMKNTSFYDPVEIETDVYLLPAQLNAESDYSLRKGFSLVDGSGAAKELVKFSGRIDLQVSCRNYWCYRNSSLNANQRYAYVINF